MMWTPCAPTFTRSWSPASGSGWWPMPRWASSSAADWIPLWCALWPQRCSDKPIRTFAIGMSEDAIDLKYAREVADYIGSDHTEVYHDAG